MVLEYPHLKSPGQVTVTKLLLISISVCASVLIDCRPRLCIARGNKVLMKSTNAMANICWLKEFLCCERARCSCKRDLGGDVNPSTHWYRKWMNSHIAACCPLITFRLSSSDLALQAFTTMLTRRMRLFVDFYFSHCFLIPSSDEGEKPGDNKRRTLSHPPLEIVINCSQHVTFPRYKRKFFALFIHFALLCPQWMSPPWAFSSIHAACTKLLQTARNKTRKLL
jgi:hypothetical protein